MQTPETHEDQLGFAFRPGHASTLIMPGGVSAEKEIREELRVLGFLSLWARCCGHWGRDWTGYL